MTSTKWIIAGLATIAVVVAVLAAGDPQDRVTICHEPSGEYETIQVNGNAVAAHLAHGDTQGPCGPVSPTTRAPQ